jgi:small subunit ribosomal protein S4
MGNTRKFRRKYSGPAHMWQKDRILLEKDYTKEYGFKNKKEIWKMTSLLNKFQALAKEYIYSRTRQAEKESKQLLTRLKSIGLLNEASMLNDVLTLTGKDLFERRLQTIVFRMGLARSVKQSRQLISHGHIKVNGTKVSSPSYIVKKAEEDKITFAENSSFSDAAHPERTVIDAKKAADLAKKAQAQANGGEVKEEKREERKDRRDRKPRQRREGSHHEKKH